MVNSKSRQIHDENQSIYSKKIKNPKGKYDLPKIIRIFGLSLALIVFSYQSFLLYSEYAMNKIKIESDSIKTGEISIPNFSFCAKLSSFLNLKQLMLMFPDIGKQVSTLSSTKQYSKWKIQDIITQVIGTSNIYERATTSQLFQSIVSLSSIISECLIRLPNMTVTTCSHFNWTKSILSKKLCLTLESNQVFHKDDLIFEYFDEMPLLFLRLNLSSFESLNEFAIVAHESISIPWFPNPHLFYANLEKKYNFFSFSFTKFIYYNLPKPYHDNCRVRPGNFYDVSHCYENCLVKPFAEIVGAYPREYTVKEGDNFKLIDNYTQEVKYNNVSYQLYRLCLPLCGHTDCISVKYNLNSRKIHFLNSSSDKLLDIEIFPSKEIVRLKFRKPAISDSNFISSLGGLLGLWFGLSICSLFNFILNTSINQNLKQEGNKVEPVFIARMQRVKQRRFAVTKLENFETLGYFPKKHHLTLVNEMNSNRTHFR